MMKVKIKEPVCKGYVLPPRTKGRVHELLREYPQHCEPVAGDDIVLTPSEVRSLLNPIRINPVVVDPDADGLNFTLRLHNPAQRKTSYRLSVPFLGTETEGSIRREEKIRLSPPQTLPAGCHRIAVSRGDLRAEAIVPVLRPGSVLSYKIDVDGDGFPERVLENDFLRVSLAPHLGARCQSIQMKRSKTDMLTRTYEYGKEEYVEYGGADEHIDDFPGELWKAKFKEIEGNDSSVTFSHSSKGITMKKRVTLLPSLPLLYHSIVVRRKTGGEKNVLYWHRMVLGTDDPSWSTLLHLHTEEKYETIRHTSPASFWRERRDYYGVRTGSAVLRHENRREVFCFSTHPDSLELLGSTSAKGYHLLTPHFHRKKLKAGEESEYGFVYILGDDFALDPSGCFVVSTGPWNGERRLLSVVARVEAPTADVVANLSTGELLHLKSTNMKGIGTILSATTEVGLPGRVAVELKTDSGEYSLETGEAK